MNPYQPSANSHAVQQRLEDRRTAAANYRNSRIADNGTNNKRWTNWKCAIGNSLIEIGEQLTKPKSPSLPAV